VSLNWLDSIPYDFLICLKASIEKEPSFTAEVVFWDGKGFVPSAILWSSLLLMSTLKMLSEFFEYTRISKTLVRVNLFADRSRKTIELCGLLSFFTSPHEPLRSLALSISLTCTLKHYAERCRINLFLASPVKNRLVLCIVFYNGRDIFDIFESEPISLTSRWIN